MHLLRTPAGATAGRRHCPRRFLVGVLALSAMTVVAREPVSMKSDASCCSLIELRQYTLHPGQRDTLIELFDREFVETQEALGIAVIGQFRDLDRPDRFVWIRGFVDADARGQELAAFYDGPVWRAHRDAANSTMTDSDNVLLLESAGPNRGFPGLPLRTNRTGDASASSSLVVMTLYYTKPELLEAFSALFSRSIRNRFERAGAHTLAEYVTSTQVNNFPRLPMRLGEHIFVWLARFESVDAYNAYRSRMSADLDWEWRAWPAIHAYLVREPEVLRLAPTARSRLRG
jgi:hypothetical protein